MQAWGWDGGPGSPVSQANAAQPVVHSRNGHPSSVVAVSMYKMSFLMTELGHRGMPPARAGQQSVSPSPHYQMLLDSTEIRIRNILDLAGVWFWLTAFLLWIKGLSVSELQWQLSDV